MRKVIYLLIGIITILLSIFTSCTEETEKISQEEFPQSVELIKNKEVSMAGILVPENIRVDKNKATITFLASTRVYTITLTDEISKQCVSFLEKAKQNRIPVNVYTLQTGNEIARISQIPTELHAKYNFSQGRDEKAKSRANLSPSIPDMETFLEIMEDIYFSDINPNYSGDGCYARAHRVRQIVNAHGYECYKQFYVGDDIYNNRNFACWDTRNQCCSYWRYHVAAYVYVDDSENGKIIIDPLFALFPGYMGWDEYTYNITSHQCLYQVPPFDMFEMEGEVFALELSQFAPGSVVHMIKIYDDNYQLTDYVLNLVKDYQGCGPIY